MDTRESKNLFGKSHTGVLLDGAHARLDTEDSCRNVAVIATTGAGKTVSYILPNLLTQNHGSIIATDPSGTLYARTSGDLVKRGYAVYQLNPLDLAASIGYNPLALANTFPEMQEIAHILVRTATGDTKQDPFWIPGAETIISILIKCLKHHPDSDRYANLANLQNQFEDYLFSNTHLDTPSTA